MELGKILCFSKIQFSFGTYFSEFGTRVPEYVPYMPLALSLMAHM